MGENVHLALPACQLVTNPRGVFFFSSSCSPPPHSITWRSFQIRQPQLLDFMWNLTKCWCRFKESLWFPLVEQEVSFLTPSSVVTPVYVPVRCDTPPPPSPARKNTLGPDQREVIYLFVGYTKELILTTLIKTENLHLWFCNWQLQHTQACMCANIAFRCPAVTVRHNRGRSSRFNIYLLLHQTN